MDRQKLIDNVAGLVTECHEKGYTSVRLFLSEAEALLGRISELEEENQQLRLLLKPVAINLRALGIPLPETFPWQTWLPATLEELEATSDAELLKLPQIGYKRLSEIRLAQRVLRREISGD